MIEAISKQNGYKSVQKDLGLLAAVPKKNTRSGSNIEDEFTLDKVKSTVVHFPTCLLDANRPSLSHEHIPHTQWCNQILYLDF